MPGPGHILTVNSGSSSLKASLFLPDGSRQNWRFEHIGSGEYQNHAAAFDALLEKLGDHAPELVGHRFVHGGDINDAARLLTPKEIERLKAISCLAPLHMPGNILGAELCASRFSAPQIACFDTAFHRTLPEIAWRLPIPNKLKLRRYGFHGLNYAYIASQLPALLGEQAQGRIIVAHLGSGSSLCLMQNLKSIATSMGYTPAGGIPMGTRSGDIDPGVILELAKQYDAQQLSHLVFHQMGLLALSNGEASEMSELAASNSRNAEFAINYYAYEVRGAIGQYAAKVGGLDALVFTAGIGEHSASVRHLICEQLAFLGFYLDETLNAQHARRLNTQHSKPVLLIPADEEAQIAKLTRTLAETNF